MSTEDTSLSPDRSQPLPWFWRIIDGAAGDRKRLVELLDQLNRGALGRFIWTFSYAITELCTDTVREAMAPRESEDGMSDLAEWVISKGERYYQAVLADPQSVEAPSITPDSPCFVAEALRVYKKRYGTDPPPPPP